MSNNRADRLTDRMGSGQQGSELRGLNASVLFVSMLGVGILIGFSQSIILNLIVIAFGFIYLAAMRARLKTALIALAVAFPLALGTWSSFMFFAVNHAPHTAWLYGTRVYAYLALGMMVTMTKGAEEVLTSLHQHLHLSNTFVFGLLGSFNLVKSIHDQYKRIMYSAMLRGDEYHLWQPRLYLRFIITALNWSGDLAQGMTSEGFSEGAPRTELVEDVCPIWQWVLAVVLIALFAVGAFVIRPW
ncbi:energy-coupling factor transporter transmembrane protein EcfT [Atopobium sp. oral taxon 416]|uniref:energy-coupling factor transporter transmembrane component T family protein n=1 Tax=Atopobium sp. oral taxon 416 TaxID=712157 RepID=UPI001BAA9A53|nr:energy-coupling factor transporter transmembrane component T [Atopobium sp. oral taxon 416]QUC04526.1 hypothetical protein J4859_06280 [Atopobium sp. oral taxon 416]